MCGLKCCFRVLVIALIIQSGQLISSGPSKEPAEILWSLSQRAIQGRQLKHKQYPSEFQLHPERFSSYTGPVKPSPASRKQYGLLQNYRPGPNPNAGFQRPLTGYPPGFPRPPPALPPGYQHQQNLGFPSQSFTGALQSVAQNDDLHCVPRLLCELTSGPSAGQKQPSVLPFNINVESLLGVLSMIGGTQSSPIFEFGKAALLGYTSKGNSGSCQYAYPRCPQDPDRLIEYLNNHNGGFFRFFNGVPPNGYPQQYTQPNPGYPPMHYPQFAPQYPRFGFYQQAQKRILTQPVQSTIKFPSRFNDEINNEVTFQQEHLVFPVRENFNDYKQDVGRRQKSVVFPLSDFKFEKPLPSTKQVNLIFPDRTGTGELRLDVDELNANYNNYYPRLNYQNHYRKVNKHNFVGDGRKKLLRFPLSNHET